MAGYPFSWSLTLAAHGWPRRRWAVSALLVASLAVLYASTGPWAWSGRATAVVTAVYDRLTRGSQMHLRAFGG